MRKIKCECQKCHGNDAFSIQYILENKSEFSESIIDFVEYMVTDFKRSISCPQKPIKKEESYIYSKTSYNIFSFFSNILESFMLFAILYVFLWIFVDNESNRHMYGVIVYLAVFYFCYKATQETYDNRKKSNSIAKENNDKLIKEYNSDMDIYNEQAIAYNREVFAFNNLYICQDCLHIFEVYDETDKEYSVVLKQYITLLIKKIYINRLNNK